VGKANPAKKLKKANLDPPFNPNPKLDHVQFRNMVTTQKSENSKIQKFKNCHDWNKSNNAHRKAFSNF